MNALLEGRYILTFVGTTMGAVILPSVAALQSALVDTFPNPGCPIHDHLVDLRNWDRDVDDAPFCVFYVVGDESEQYVVSIFREKELVS